MPRAGLSTARVVEVAAELVDERGWEALTLAAVADRVGVRLPSLYKHVGGVDHLRQPPRHRAARRRGVERSRGRAGRRGGAASAVAGAAGVGPRPLRPVRGHPARAARCAAVDPDDEAASAAATQPLFGRVRDLWAAGGPVLVDAARTVRAALDGFVTIEASDGFGLTARWRPRSPGCRRRSTPRCARIVSPGQG
ncbi:MAG: TetR family transcriptional regulator [Myxococcota bacterium]